MKSHKSEAISVICQCDFSHHDDIDCSMRIRVKIPVLIAITDISPTANDLSSSVVGLKLNDGTCTVVGNGVGLIVGDLLGHQ